MMPRRLAGTLILVTLAGCELATPKDRDDLKAAFAQYSQRQYDAADRTATSYIQKFPNDEHLDEAHYLRALARHGMKNRAGAAQDLHAAIAKTKRADLKLKSHRLLGDLSFEGQHWEQAFDYYKKAGGNEASADPRVTERMGACLQALGKWDDARPYFQRIIETKAEPALVQRAIARKNAKAFELQFGAYQDVGNARADIARLKAEGIAAIPLSEMRDGKLWWLVRSGSYRTYAEADTARQRFIARHPLVIIVP